MSPGFWRKKEPSYQQEHLMTKIIPDDRLVSLTNIGLNRDENDDVAVASKNSYDNLLILVCDGLGGYLGGKDAARIVSETILSSFLSTNFSKLSTKKINDWFIKTINDAKINITKWIADNPVYYKMATTVAICIVTDKKIYCFNIGDSRIYGIKNGLIEQISVDHNLYNKLKQENWSEKQMEFYQRSLYSIVNYVASFDESELIFDLYEYDRHQYQYLITMTDGIHNFLSDNQVNEHFTDDKPIKTIADNVINQALSQLSNDNLSLAIVNLKDNE